LKARGKHPKWEDDGRASIPRYGKDKGKKCKGKSNGY
jgi:hypothetical protein